MHNKLAKAPYLLSGHFLNWILEHKRKVKIFNKNILIGCCFVLCCQTSPIFEAFVGWTRRTMDFLTKKLLENRRFSSQTAQYFHPWLVSSPYSYYFIKKGFVWRQLTHILSPFQNWKLVQRLVGWLKFGKSNQKT